MNSLQEELLAGFGDVVDRIVCTPVGGAPVIRRGRSGPVLSRYLWMKVYDETRRRFGRSLTLLATEALMNKVCEGYPVLILTNSNETDGPPGAAAIARALIVGLRAIPIIISNYEAETKFERCVPETCIGAELLPVYDPEDLKGNIWTPYSVLVQNWPKMSIAQTEKESKRILDLFKPKAVITVEAISCNQKGVLHGTLGGAGSSDNPDEEIVR